MRKAVLLFMVLSFIFSPSFGKSDKRYGDLPQKVIVAGKIDHYDPSKEVVIYVDKLGMEHETIEAMTDSAGNFRATFESYTPVDAAVMYKTNFRILLHPGDSLFIHFDGQYGNRPELLRTIRFGGNRAETNQYAAAFQQMFFANEIYTDRDSKSKAVKEYDAYEYRRYLDALRQKARELYDQFVAEHHPDEESRKWALFSLESDYYYYIYWYVRDHREANGMGWDDPWDAPEGFYDVMSDRLPIDSSMFINSSDLNQFVEYYSKYVADKLKERATGDGWGVVFGGLLGEVTIIDSLRIFGTIEFVDDPLLRQIMLTRHFEKDFRTQDISAYEKYRDVADMYIREPFLKEPLHQKYLQTKMRIENPKIYTEAVLKESANLSVNQILDDILQQNKGKVIYVDFWGTWCGPCIAELPNSKKVEEDFSGQDVAMVYIALQSDEVKWKAMLDEFQLGGQHYFLSDKQSKDMIRLMEIVGVPFYMLIDKEGVIKEKGSHLRPLEAKGKIGKILK